MKALPASQRYGLSGFGVMLVLMFVVAIFLPFALLALIPKTRKVKPARLIAPTAPRFAWLAGATLSGKVVTEDGKPVRDVLVSAVVQGNTSATGMDAQGRTRKDGTYTISGLVPGKQTVFIYREPTNAMTAPAISNINAVPIKTVMVPKMVLSRATTVTGVVTDATDGKPIEGVLVSVEGPSRPHLNARNASGVKTDANGRYTLAVAPGKNHVRIERVVRATTDKIGADEAGKKYEVIVTLTKGQSKQADFRLARAHYDMVTFAGRVVYEDGSLAAGIRVIAQENNNSLARQMGRWNLAPMLTFAETTTAADGTYRLTGLAAIPYNVATDEKTKSWTSAAQEGVRGMLGQTKSVPDIILTTGAIIEGTVTDENTGKPIKGVYIGCYGPHRPNSSAMVLNCLTDAQGHYRLRVPPGKSRIYVMQQGFTDKSVEVIVKKGETTPVPFKLDGSQVTPMPDGEE